MKISAIVLVLLGLVVFGCSKQNFDVVYKMDRGQGNYLSQKAIQQLKIGMSKEQVHYLMGSPAIIDTFQPDTWHYLYTFQAKNQKPVSEKLTLMFKNNQLDKIDNQTL